MNNICSTMLCVQPGRATPLIVFQSNSDLMSNISISVPVVSDVVTPQCCVQPCICYRELRHSFVLFFLPSMLWFFSHKLAFQVSLTHGRTENCGVTTFPVRWLISSIQSPSDLMWYGVFYSTDADTRSLTVLCASMSFHTISLPFCPLFAWQIATQCSY